MCVSERNISTQNSQYEKKYTLASFFRAHWNEYLSNPKYPVKDHQRYAVQAIMKCRTAELGQDVYKCKDCGDTVDLYFSCKNRFCPTCSWSDTLKWAETLHSQLLNVPHRHVVMTLPHQLNSLIRRNPKFFYQTLLKESSTLLRDYIRKLYNVDIGVVSVLHTYGEQKKLHVHVHMIVSWGGIDMKNNRLKSIPISDRIDYLKLKEIFRSRIIRCIDLAYYKGNLRHDFNEEQEFIDFKDKLVEKKWIIHLEPPMNIPEQIIRYIGRYSKRACLSEYKITDISGPHISFRYKDYKEKTAEGKPTEKILKLHYNDFFPLLLQHVPLTNFRLVRYYGVYNARNKTPKTFTEKPKYKEKEILTPFIDNRKECRICSGNMEHIKTIVRPGSILWFIQQRKYRQKLKEKYAA
jgi:hypothetical protein